MSKVFKLLLMGLRLVSSDRLLPKSRMFVSSAHLVVDADVNAIPERKDHDLSRRQLQILTSWTNMNENSNRSRSLTRISVVCRWECNGKVESSKLWMVYLGGSERLLKSGATGLTLNEGRDINLSLLALGDVIAALRRRKGHVPYRNSKLMQILKDSLETLCSLSFAKRARAAESDREKSEDLKKQREKKLLELEENGRETEEQCRVVGGKAEFLLSESKKLLTSRGPPDDHTEPITPHSDKQSAKSPKVSAKTNLGPSSLPRLMNSTVTLHQQRITTEQ